MAYELIYANDALEQLSQYPFHIQDIIFDNLEKLADDPVSASHPPSSTMWPAH